MHEAEAEAAYWPIKDEGAMADYLDPVEDAEELASVVTLERYADRDALDPAVERMQERRRRSPAGD